MSDRMFDLLMVLLGAVTAKAIDEIAELVKKGVDKKKDSEGSKPKES